MLRLGTATNQLTTRQFGDLQNAVLFALKDMIWLRVSHDYIFLLIFQTLIQGKKRDSHRCQKSGKWQKPEKVVLSCVANGKLIKQIVKYYNLKRRSDRHQRNVIKIIL